MSSFGTLNFEMAVDQYRKRFNDLPTVFGIEDYAGMARVLMAAVRAGKPLSDNDFYRQLGIKPPPAGVFS